MCGGSNLSTILLLWGIYIKKCISLVRICLQTENARNASTKFRKTSESKKAEKSLEISAFLVFSCLHLNQTLIMAGIAGLEPAECQSQSLMPYHLAISHYQRIITQKSVFVKHFQATNIFFCTNGSAPRPSPHCCPSMLLTNAGIYAKIYLEILEILHLKASEVIHIYYENRICFARMPQKSA